MKESIRPATVNTPPTMAQVLHSGDKLVSTSIPVRGRTDEVKKWAKDCRVSVKMTFIGEIS